MISQINWMRYILIEGDKDWLSEIIDWLNVILNELIEILDWMSETSQLIYWDLNWFSGFKDWLTEINLYLNESI